MPKIGRPTTLPEPWRALAEHAGGVAKLAERFGVNVRTIWVWAHGQGMYAIRHQAVFDALKKEMDARTRRKRAKKPPAE